MDRPATPASAVFPRFVVLKFGGTSVSSRARWETIAEVVRKRRAEGFTPVVVCSAVGGISNLLEQLLDAAVRGEHEPILEQIEARHRTLGAELEVQADELLAAHFAELRRLALGASLLGDVSARVKARVMAIGELMSTALGAAFLRPLEPRLLDARDLLVSLRDPHASESRRYLSASCSSQADLALHDQLLPHVGSVILTQGFIARNPDGETVLLGRGGSDTSAAYFAARLQAERLEIWTDVPGMFTGNPRHVASARLLKRLGYDEAQEIATTGAKVLHPRCIEPARRHGIPIHIKDTNRPDLEGTVVSRDVLDGGARVKAVAARSGLVLVSMDTLGMWQQVGFLADVFETFKRHGLSVDQVATSDANVTVSLDPASNVLDHNALQALIEDLSSRCTAKLIGPCAAISLVGRNLRSLLPRLAPALEVFEEKRVFLLTQAASDLNLTLVIEEEGAEAVLHKLHDRLFAEQGPSELFGPSWQELQGAAAEEESTALEPWWHRRAAELVALGSASSPAYVYDEATLRSSVADVLGLDAIARAFYAVKANFHPGILRIFEAEGLGFECVSPGEIAHVQGLFPQLDPKRILFTPNFAPAHEYAFGFDAGVHVTLDNLHPLESRPEIFAGREILVRIDPGHGDGHHKHVKTGGAYSKFGIPVHELPRLVELASHHGVRIVGLHAHVGSGIRSADTWQRTALFLVSMAERWFPDARTLDLGGGLGITEKPGQKPLDFTALAQSLREFAAAHPRYELWLEPGRYLVAQAGVLVAKVTQIKRKEDQWYVGVDAGMNTLIRPALYGAFHEICNLTRLGEPAAICADVVGPICETGDVLGHERPLPVTEEGDVILVATAGAYGRSMSSHYNLREPAAEVLLPPATEAARRAG